MTSRDAGADALRDWLLRREEATTPEVLIAELCARLEAIGFPVWRAATSLRTLHPELFVTNVVWQRGVGTRTSARHHDITESPGYRVSPVAVIHGGVDRIRQRLDVPPETLPYPLLVDFARQGGTDYVIEALTLADGRRSFVSFTTDHPGGFAPEHLDALAAIRPALNLRLELESAYLATRSLLEVYLGPNAARRVLAGAFKRGGGESIRAAIWFCDLRGFTELGDRLHVEEVVELLDRYFEHVAGPVNDAGGEVLKFIGDAMLAILPVDDAGPAEPCARARAAAEAALAGLEALNRELAAEGRPCLGVGIALHLGEVMYGNIGARGRLDFTVIGAPVNEACRVESLCKPLGTPLLCTAAFAAAVPSAALVSLGAHALKGVRDPVEVFTLRR